MKTIFTILVVLFSALCYGQAKQINWMSWQQAVNQQKADLEKYNSGAEGQKTPPKKMFVDLYTDWCGWCKRMDATTFQDPAVVEIMNKYFYPVKFDAEQLDTIVFNGHKFFNPIAANGKKTTHTLAASILDYKLSYPSYVLLDENTSRMVIYPGYKQVEDLLGILLFYGTNQHLTYQQFLKQQDEIAKQQGKQ